MTPDQARKVVVGFVEGRIAAEEFRRFLYDEPAIEALLSDDPDLPPTSYVRSSTYHYLLGLEYGDPGGALDAQGALSEWLERHGIAHARDTSVELLHDLLLRAQPSWLSVDTMYLKEAFLARAGTRSGDELREWLHRELLRAFRYVGKPPEWIQSPEWPINANGPLVFLGQLAVEHYFHDVAVAYVFHDPAVNECTTVIQVA
jgi:hypothetical protein